MTSALTWHITPIYLDHTVPSLEPSEGVGGPGDDRLRASSLHRRHGTRQFLLRWGCDVGYEHDRPSTQEHTAAIDDGLVEPGLFLYLILDGHLKCV